MTNPELHLGILQSSPTSVRLPPDADRVLNQSSTNDFGNAFIYIAGTKIVYILGVINSKVRYRLSATSKTSLVVVSLRIPNQPLLYFSSTSYFSRLVNVFQCSFYSPKAAPSTECYLKRSTANSQWNVRHDGTSSPRARRTSAASSSYLNASSYRPSCLRSAAVSWRL